MADKKKTDKPTDRQINTHYSFIGIDVRLLVYLFACWSSFKGRLTGFAPCRTVNMALYREMRFVNLCFIAQIYMHVAIYTGSHG